MNRETLIVGGSSGIGLELTRLLAGRGEAVHVASRQGESVSAIEGVAWQSYDATDAASALAVPERLDGFVYCPGSIVLKPFHRITDEEFRAELEINYLGAMRALRQALPALKRSDAASVVLFSTVAVATGLPYHAAIAGAKGAIEAVTRSLAAELAPGIRVNCLALSLTDTPLAGGLLSTPEKRQAAAERHPLKRIGDAAGTAAATAFLLGRESGFMTGQVLHLDGGLSTLRPL